MQDHFFWENEANLVTFQKFAPHIGVFCKLILKPVKKLN